MKIQARQQGNNKTDRRCRQPARRVFVMESSVVKGGKIQARLDESGKINLNKTGATRLATSATTTSTTPTRTVWRVKKRCRFVLVCGQDGAKQETGASKWRTPASLSTNQKGKRKAQVISKGDGVLHQVSSS